MQSYRIDFAMNRGHEMTIDRVSGILRSELDEIELNMLHSQRIPYLLPIDWFELDGKVTFRYTLTGMKMLLHRLQQQPLTMEQYYTLILGVTDALHDCKHYMLRPEGCLLDEQFIFIGEQLHDIRLAYVPMKDNCEEQPIGSGDLLSLIVRFTSYIDQIDGEGLKRVLHHLTGKKWPLAELRAALLDLIGDSSVQSGNGKEQQVQQQPRPREQQLQQVRQQPSERQHAPMQPHYLSDIKVESSIQPARAKSMYADIPYVEDQEEAEQVTKKKWIVTAGLVIANACVWRFVHFAAATRQSLLISIGLTFLLLAAILFVWRRRVNQLASSVEAQLDMEQFVSGPGNFSKLKNWQADHDMIDTTSKHSSDYLHEGSEDNSVFPLHVAAANPVYPVVEPTVLLGRDLDHQHELSSHSVVWLQRSWESNETKLELLEGFFKIGRTGEQVSYADHAYGVSRLHLEIESMDGEQKAKDLGSRNGSLLNGQTMIPYKSYKLSTGDVIHLAGAKGPSYELKSG